MRPLVAIAAILLSATTLTAGATSLAADMKRSLGLREQWIGLTRDVAWPAHWHDDGRFHYRKTVTGGFRFQLFDPGKGVGIEAFNHERLAHAIQVATGQAQKALHLPFDDYTHEVVAGIAYARLQAEGKQLRCNLRVYLCEEQAAPLQRPRGFDVLRDLRVVADNAPRRSADGQWEAFAEGYDLVLRSLADGSVRQLTHDGQQAGFYDPESIAWSPDSLRLAFYRVKPGEARLVTRVETSPTGGGQPRVQLQLYPKPSDAVDIEQRFLAEVASGRVTRVDDALFANPYQMSPLRWRADGRGFAFDYVQRGHQRVRLIEVSSNDAHVRVVASEDSRTFVDAWRPYRYEIDDGRQLLWLSERDGWRHLYLYDGATGKVLRQLTHGRWVVREVLKVDATRRQVWFSASGMDAGRDPYYRQVFRVDLDGGEPVRLTQPMRITMSRPRLMASPT